MLLWLLKQPGIQKGWKLEEKKLRNKIGFKTWLFLEVWAIIYIGKFGTRNYEPNQNIHTDSGRANINMRSPMNSNQPYYYNFESGNPRKIT